MKYDTNQQICLEANQLNMNILTVGYGTLGEDWAMSHAMASFTRVYFVVDGEGDLVFRDSKVHMVPGNIYIIPSNLDFAFYTNSFLTKMFCHISLPQSNGYDLLANLGQCMILYNCHHEIEEALVCFAGDDLFSAVSLKSLLFRLIHRALRIAKLPIQSSVYSDTIQNVLEYIEQNLHSAMTAREIADRFFRSPGSLQKLFRKEVGVNLGRFLEDKVFERAEQMLIGSQLSIKEISDSLGFCDQFYFSRMFKNRYGISPLKYRNGLI